MTSRETLFPQLFANQPPLVRQFLRAALRVDALEELYSAFNESQSVSLSDSMLDILQIRVRVAPKDLQHIPRSGPVVLVANHPHGFLDGFVIDHVVSQIRPDLKLLVNDMVAGLNGMAGRSIAVDVFGTDKARNFKAARDAITWLQAAHSLVMFPAGEVSHWQLAEKRVSDGPWSDFSVRCALRAGATIVPIFITGSNSFTFNLSGALHPRLRTARLSAELFHKRSSTVEVRVGKPIKSQELAEFTPENAATAYVRARVYLLSYRHETKQRRFQNLLPRQLLQRPKPICQRAPMSIEGDIAALRERGKCIVENENYWVIAEQGRNIPAILQEIGRLREVTFREAGEGTGKAIDLDEFDATFTHLVLWHKNSKSIAGSYRLAWTQDLPSPGNPHGLYTAKLFRYAPDFLNRLGAAVELGRSFIVKEHQREMMPLFLLWQGIGHYVARRPDSAVLFGAVSISATYSETSRAMMVELLRRHNFRHDLDPLIMPRRPFVSPLIRKPELNVITQCLPDVQDLPIADVDSQDGVPVLLRQYLRLGGKVAGFNLDPRFSNALDALLVLDLRQTPRRLLTKYMGAENAARFLNS